MGKRNQRECGLKKIVQESYWVYILYCANNTYYTGYTNDLNKRFEAHVNGTASKYTRSFKPLRIAQSWKIDGDKSLAMKTERYIKKLTRAEKEKIIANPLMLNTHNASSQ
jgi:putative endonuclease